MLLRQCFALVLTLACGAPVLAGMDKEGTSARPGLFFAWLSPDDGPVWMRFENPEHLKQLAGHCNAGRDVFALEAGARYRCKAEASKNGAGEDDGYAAGVTVNGPSPTADGPRYRLFSVKPPSTPHWVVGKPDADSLEALQAFLQSDARRFGALRRHLKPHLATAIRQPQGTRLTVVVPGKVVRDRAAYYDAQRHHVFVRGGGGYSYLGEIPGKPDSYVDIDGNDLPGMVASEGCDGWCISLWGLTGGLRRVGSFGGH